MTGRHDDDEVGLTAFFDAARDTAPEPDAALLARVLQDSEAAQAAQASARPAAARRKRVDWGAIWQALGGWPSIAGLSVATVAGIWIGATSPAMLGGPVQALVGAEPDVVIDAELVTAFLIPGEDM